MFAEGTVNTICKDLQVLDRVPQWFKDCRLITQNQWEFSQLPFKTRANNKFFRVKNARNI